MQRRIEETAQMQRRRLSMAASTVAIGGLLLAGCGGNADTGDDGAEAEAAGEGSSSSEAAGLGETLEVEARTLTYASIVGRDNFDSSDAMEELMERVSDRTDGAIEFETFYDESLCGASEMSACVSDGRADIGYTSSLYNPSDFPFTSIGNVPFQSSNVSAVVQTMNDLYDEGTQVTDEFEALNQELIWFNPNGMTLLAMADEMTSFDDFSGRSIRATGGLVPALEELGITPVAVDTSEQYESVQRGVIDGSAQNLAGHSFTRLYEVAPHLYDLGEYSGSYATLHTVINADVWANFEPELQDLFREIADDISERMESDFLAPTLEVHCTNIVEGGGTINPMPDPEAFVEWASESVETAMTRWIEGNEDPGAAEFADLYLETLREMEGEFDYRSGSEICAETLESGS